MFTEEGVLLVIAPGSDEPTGALVGVGEVCSMDLIFNRLLCPWETGGIGY